MSETINIKRYRLAYSGRHDGEVKRVTLRPVAVPTTAKPPAGQRNAAMYASPART
jgi:hypothetical protein